MIDIKIRVGEDLATWLHEEAEREGISRYKLIQKILGTYALGSSGSVRLTKKESRFIANMKNELACSEGMNIARRDAETNRDLSFALLCYDDPYGQLRCDARAIVCNATKRTIYTDIMQCLNQVFRRLLPKDYRKMLRDINRNNDNDINDYATPVLKVLSSIYQHHDAISDEINEEFANLSSNITASEAFNRGNK